MKVEVFLSNNSFIFVVQTNFFPPPSFHKTGVNLPKSKAKRTPQLKFCGLRRKRIYAIVKQPGFQCIGESFKIELVFRFVLQVSFVPSTSICEPLGDLRQSQVKRTAHHQLCGSSRVRIFGVVVQPG